MTPLVEATAILNRVAALLISAARNEAGRQGAELRLACGDLVDGVAVHLSERRIGEHLAAVFRAATEAGCRFSQIEQVLAGIQRERPSSPIAKAICTGCTWFGLIEMARISSVTAFRSREDAQSIGVRVNATFAPAEDAAADQGEHRFYRDLVALHAAVTRDLVERGRPLPRIVPYRTAMRLPALALSNRIYGAADRADELVGENHAVHPLFMPAAGRAFSG
jgi:prophage DNA circulation protein